MIGWTATGAAIDMRALAVVAVMFLWQFPHFMAIAWLYRADYVRGGQRMLTVVDPTGFAPALRHWSGVALVPVSLVPAMSPQAGSPAFIPLGRSRSELGRRSRQRFFYFTATIDRPGDCCGPVCFT